MSIKKTFAYFILSIAVVSPVVGLAALIWSLVEPLTFFIGLTALASLCLYALLVVWAIEVISKG